MLSNVTDVRYRVKDAAGAAKSVVEGAAGAAKSVVEGGAVAGAAKTEVEDEAKAGTTESPKKSQESDGANADGAVTAVEARDESETESETESECIDGKCKMCGNDIWPGTRSLCKMAWRSRASGCIVYSARNLLSQPSRVIDLHKTQSLYQTTKLVFGSFHLSVEKRLACAKH